MEKPDVDYIEGLSPAISIDQKGVTRNPRSTVGTVTEVYDYLRLLFARVGIPHCPICGRRVTAQTVSQMVDTLAALPEGTRFLILAPVVHGRQGRVPPRLRGRPQGRLRPRPRGRHRLPRGRGRRSWTSTASTTSRWSSTAWSPARRWATGWPTPWRRPSSWAPGLVLVNLVDRPAEDLLFSERYSCPVHKDISLEQIEPRTFSFNSPRGACPACTGLGTTLEIDPELVLPNRHLSIEDGAIAAWPITRDGYYTGLLESVGQALRLLPQRPGRAPHRGAAARCSSHGSGDERIPLRFQSKKRGRAYEYRTVFEGVVPNLQRRYRETESAQVKEELERYMMNRPCPECGGARLKPASLAVTVAELNIAQVTGLLRRAGGALLRHPGREADRAGGADRAPDPEGDPGAPGLPAQRGAALPHPGPPGAHPLRGRGAADPPGQPDRLGPGGGAVHPGRALHRAAPAGQRQADPRPWSDLRDIGNTVVVVEHDVETMQRGRLHRGLRPRGGRARRAGRGQRGPGGHRPLPANRSPGSTSPGPQRSGCPPAAPGGRANGERLADGARGAGAQPQGT